MSATMPPVPELTTLAPYLDKLPPMISRKKVSWFTGGAIQPKTLANADARGCGPEVRQKIGEEVVYPTHYFLSWLESRGVKTIVIPKFLASSPRKRRSAGRAKDA